MSRWFLEAAVPLWDEHGVDRSTGGYFETLSVAGTSAVPDGAGAVRRGRVVARQLYVFDLAQRWGWRSIRDCPVDHGLDYLFTHMHAGDGRLHTAVDGTTLEPRAPFSLYEQAFYLFALARLEPSRGRRYPIAATAARSLERLRREFGKPVGGFEESQPPSLPLKSNPHMHLLEAALAWVEVAQEADVARWVDLCRELVRLCLTRFRDANSGVIREFFDFHWRPAAGDDGRVIEPGHQFEWAWLLMQWSRSPHSTATEKAACDDAAGRLVESGELGVVDGRGVAVNELWDDMTVKDCDAKLWPQTERLKAWCAVLARSRSPAADERACGQIERAARALMTYLRSDFPGLWHETCRADGRFAAGATRASSLYHIACAIDVLRRVIERRSRAPLVLLRIPHGHVTLQ